MTTDTSFKEFEQMRVTMEPLMYQYGVDLFYNGNGFSVSWLQFDHSNCLAGQTPDMPASLDVCCT